MAVPPCRDTGSASCRLVRSNGVAALTSDTHPTRQVVDPSRPTGCARGGAVRGRAKSTRSVSDRRHQCRRLARSPANPDGRRRGACPQVRLPPDLSTNRRVGGPASGDRRSLEPCHPFAPAAMRRWRRPSGGRSRVGSLTRRLLPCRGCGRCNRGPPSSTATPRQHSRGFRGTAAWTWQPTGDSPSSQPDPGGSRSPDWWRARCGRR